MIDKEAYEYGRRMYRRHGYKPAVSPYIPGTEAFNSFERGMTQAYKSNPGIHYSNEQEDKAEAEAAVKEAKAKQCSDEKERIKKRKAYIDATKAG